MSISKTQVQPTLKIIYDGKTRRARCPSNYQDLVKTISSTCTLEPDKFLIKYYIENDEILYIKNQADLDNAIESLEDNKSLRVYISDIALYKGKI